MSSKTDSVVKLAIVFFISLLSFSVGTFVGKKYSDNQHQLAALEPQKNSHGGEREVASVHGTEGEQKAGAMTDEEIAKLAEEFVADETTPANTEDHGGEHGAKAEVATSHEGHGAAATEEKSKVDTAAPHKVDKAAPVTKHEEPSVAAKNIASGKAPVAETVKKAAVEERVPSSLPKDVAQYSVGKFTVQVASYADEAEAQKTASELKNKGYSAFYVPANVKGKTWYRVSVGQFATQNEAQSYRAEFMSTSKMTTAIVQKITE